MNSLKLMFIGVICAIAVSIPVYMYVESRQPTFPHTNGTQRNNTNNPQKVQPYPSPTPIPFEEMTIPYLRNRQYTSSLDELEEVASTSRYTSYLTSYDSDGLRINGLLTIPVGEKPPEGYPAVVFVHGYIPPQQYRTLEKYTAYIDYLARQGLVVFKIDLRGHGDSEGVASGAYFSGDYVIDTLHARAALQDAEFVNIQQVGLWGHSMAGNVTFRAFVAQPDIPKIAIWAGAVYSYEDFEQFRISDPSYQPPSQESKRREERERLMAIHGEFDPDSPFWQKVPGTNYLDDVQGEIHIHHAINDDVVTIEYARNLATILDDTSIPHQLYEYKTGGHNISNGAFGTAMERTADFLTEY